jgi:septation ring formation regulator EzrA
LRKILCYDVSNILRLTFLITIIPAGIFYSHELLQNKLISDVVFLGLFGGLLFLSLAVISYSRLEELTFKGVSIRLSKAISEVDESVASIKSIEIALLELLLNQTERIPGAFRNLGDSDERLSTFIKTLSMLSVDSKLKASKAIEDVAVKIAWSQLKRIEDLNQQVGEIIQGKPETKSALPNLKEISALRIIQGTDSTTYKKLLEDLEAIYGVILL